MPRQVKYWGIIRVMYCSALCGLKREFPTPEDFVEALTRDAERHGYDPETQEETPWNPEDVKPIWLAWRMDSYNVFVDAPPCGFVEVGKGARGATPAWMVGSYDS